MAPPSTFKSTVTVTYIGTATAILNIDGINLLTDPVFSPAGTEWDLGIATLKNSTPAPALGPHELPPIDAVLLSHEDHPDNLDEPGRLLLDGRLVFTTADGAAKLQPRPGVRALRPWETVPLVLAGDGSRRRLDVTGTPCQHLPGGECTGFALTGPELGVCEDGRPNAVFVSGDTIYTEELAAGLRERFHVVVALLHMGSAVAPLPDGPLQITMDGKQGARLFREIGADVMVPLHYESWGHFSESKEQLVRALADESVADKVCWLKPGVATKVV